MAVLIQMTANINRDSKQRPQPFEIEEVLGWLGFPEEPVAPPPPPSAEELRDRLRLFAQFYPSENGLQEGETR